MDSFTLDKLPRKVLATIDLQTAFMASSCILAAERFQVFRKIKGKKLTAAAICKKIGAKLPRGAFLIYSLHSLGLLKRTGDLYSNSALAERYFIKERSIEWTRLYAQECAHEYRAFSVLEEMLTSGRSYESILGFKRKYYMEKMQTNPTWARDFTHMLYYHHLDLAKALAGALDLKGYRTLLDVGGGSGVMSMSLVRKYPSLTATVLDIKQVCKTARQIIKRENLSGRIKARVGDMSKRLPTGFDVVMFCDVGDTSPELFQRAFDSLPSGGMIVVADFLANEDMTEPFHRLMWQLRAKDLWLITKNQAKQVLRDCGFKSVKSRRLGPEAWLLTGMKK